MEGIIFLEIDSWTGKAAHLAPSSNPTPDKSGIWLASFGIAPAIAASLGRFPAGPGLP